MVSRKEKTAKQAEVHNARKTSGRENACGRWYCIPSQKKFVCYTWRTLRGNTSLYTYIYIMSILASRSTSYIIDRTPRSTSYVMNQNPKLYFIMELAPALISVYNADMCSVYIDLAFSKQHGIKTGCVVRLQMYRMFLLIR